MRRVKISGGTLSLQDTCSGGSEYASGGFLADAVTGPITNGSQQQFFVRNSSIGGWSNGVWNQVFCGVSGAPPQAFPTRPYTTLPTSPVTREKPFLYIDAGGIYRVFVPALRTASVGPSWSPGPAAGTSLSLDQFFIARPSDGAATINAALAPERN